MASRDLAALGYRRIVVLLVSLIVVPTALLLTLGVVLLFLGEVELNLLMGILVLALSGAAVTGVILVWVFVTKQHNVSRLQSDFVSNVSHELRTPLTSIRLFTETLSLRAGDPDAQRQCIAALERESMRLQELIDRLLDWGRMESGRRVYTIEDAAVGAILEKALQAFETVKLRERVELTVEAPSTTLRAPADLGAVSDALLNLLTNAAKYGGTPCRIRVWCRETPKAVRISVSDNGPGIPPAEHKRIFQKFYRLDDRLSREQEGSGLGLAIVKHVMKAHDGRVEVDSRPGSGSTFTLVLPRKPRQDESASPNPSETPSAAARRSPNAP